MQLQIKSWGNYFKSFEFSSNRMKIVRIINDFFLNPSSYQLSD